MAAAHISLPTLKSPVGQRLCEVAVSNIIQVFQVGQGSRDLQDTVAGSWGEVHELRRFFESLMNGGVRLAVSLHTGTVQMSIGLAGTRQLPLSCLDDPLANGFTVFGFAPTVDIRYVAGTGHFNMQIDSIKQRPRNFAAIALNLFRRAHATSRSVT